MHSRGRGEPGRHCRAGQRGKPGRQCNGGV